MRGRSISKRILMVVVTVMCATFITGWEMEAAEQAVPIVVNEDTSITALPNYNMEVYASGKNSMAFQVTEPGQLNLYVSVANISEVIKMSVYKDPALTVPVSSANYFYISPNEVTIEKAKVGSVQIPNSGVYYVAVEYNNPGQSAGLVKFSPYLYSRADQVLAQGTWSTIAAPSAKNGTYTYFQVTVPSNGYIGVDASLPSTANVYVSLCDADKNVIVTSDFKNGVTKYYPVTKGTYYLSTEGASGVWTKLKYTVQSQFTLQENNAFAYTLMGRANIDFKFKAERTGVVILVNGSGEDIDVTLLNSKKKELTNQNSGKGFSFAVKKGVTYYFRVKNDGTDAIAYSIAKTTENKNGTKKKAISLKKGKKKTCLIIASDKSKNYWYKFNIKNSSKIKLNIVNVGSGKVIYNLLDAKGKKVDGELVNNNKKIKSLKKVPKGTYYFIIRQENKATGKIDITLK